MRTNAASSIALLVIYFVKYKATLSFFFVQTPEQRTIILLIKKLIYGNNKC